MSDCTDPIINDIEWRIIGMSRSGNHAIIDWLLAQLPDCWCFLNCVEGKHNPYATARPLADGRCYRSDIPGFDLAAERQGRWHGKQHLLFSFEDNFLGNVHHPTFEAGHDRWLGRSRSRRDILILRDPYNLFASRRHDGSAQVGPAVATRIWKQHAKEALGMSRRLPSNRLVIDFDRWFLHREYRQDIAKQLDLAFDDAAAQRVATCNGGSSFDGRRYHGRAREMPVLERWRQCLDDDGYHRLFDDEVHELAQQLYREEAALDLPFGSVGALPS